MYSFTFLLVVVCALFFYRAGEFENAPGWLWGTLSAALSCLIWLYFGRGFLAVLLGQIALFAGITVVRVWKQ